MGPGDSPLSGQERRGRLLAPGPDEGGVDGLLDDLPGLRRQLPGAGRAKFADGLAVGLQDRHVDGVQGRAAHEPKYPHGSPLLFVPYARPGAGLTAIGAAA